MTYTCMYVYLCSIYIVQCIYACVRVDVCETNGKLERNDLLNYNNYPSNIYYIYIIYIFQ